VLDQATSDNENLPPTLPQPTNALEEAMEVIKKGSHSLKKANQSWNIPLTSLSNHLNGKTRSKKMGPTNVLIEEEDVVIVAWIITMQKCGLLITLQ